MIRMIPLDIRDSLFDIRYLVSLICVPIHLAY